IPASILVQSWSEVLAARSIPPCPYRSLGPFSEATAEDFYGRDTEVQTVLDAVEHNAFRHARRSDPGAPGPAASWSAWPKGPRSASPAAGEGRAARRLVRCPTSGRCAVAVLGPERRRRDIRGTGPRVTELELGTAARVDCRGGGETAQIG